MNCDFHDYCAFSNHEIPKGLNDTKKNPFLVFFVNLRAFVIQKKLFQPGMSNMTCFQYINIIFAFLLFLPSIFTNFAAAQFDPIFSLVASSTTDIRDVAISHDGNRIVTVIDDLTIWDSNTGEKLAAFSAPNVRFIFSAVFSPDDALIATGDAGHNAIIWDARTGSILQRFPSYDMNPDNGGIRGVAFTPDGNKLLMGNGNGSLQLWDVRTGEEVRRYRNHDHILSLLMLSDGNRAVIWREGAVKIIVTLYPIEAKGGS